MLALSTINLDQYAAANLDDYALMLIDPFLTLDLGAAQLHCPGAAAADILTHTIRADVHCAGAIATEIA